MSNSSQSNPAQMLADLDSDVQTNLLNQLDRPEDVVNWVNFLSMHGSVLGEPDRCAPLQKACPGSRTLRDKRLKCVLHVSRRECMVMQWIHGAKGRAFFGGRAPSHPGGYSSWIEWLKAQLSTPPSTPRNLDNPPGAPMRYRSLCSPLEQVPEEACLLKCVC